MNLMVESIRTVPPMGRHSRSAASAEADSRRGGAHRKQGPARTGLLGASAALTVSAMAAGTGILPGLGDRFTIQSADEIEALDASDEIREVIPAPPRDPDHQSGDRGEERAPAVTAEPSETTAIEESAPPAETPESSEAEQAPETESPPPSSSTSVPDSSGTGAEPSQDTAPSQPPSESAAVLSLVNEERAKAGCQPLEHDTQLAQLARDFSRDMAERGFFSHTDPDGNGPWDRADAAGIGNLGGENIARGQPDAISVMESWMNSDGHRANILNCDFTTLGVGVHEAAGGPWWTQAFGY